MMTTILTAIATYVATSVDYLIILLIFFSQENSKRQMKGVVWGQYLGTTALIVISLLAAFGLSFIPQDWVIGLLGMVPIALGLRVAFKKEKEPEEDEVIDSARKYRSVVLSMTLLTIASGGDNIGVYVPLFSSLTPPNIFVTLVVFYILVAALCFASYRLANFKYLRETIERYERIIVPVVLIGLGIAILSENGTFAAFAGLFR
ncbi:MAG: CadD family cadmium resistance transporter [Candidatus Cryosericum sp.]|nr:CadD family cadmium resistance transporter [bacterium]